VPSLTGFLEWRGQDEVEVKRQMDAAGDRIRVMTVHGAKGLEAPIVILPDCAARKAQPRPLYPWRPPAPLLGLAAEDMPRVMREPDGARPAAQARERRRPPLCRHDAGRSLAGGLRPATAGGSWPARGVERAHGPDGPGTPSRDASAGATAGDWDTCRPPRHARRTPPPPVPAPYFAPVDPPGPRATARAATDLGGAKIVLGEDEDGDPEAVRAGALARGHLVHLALEHLPSTSLRPC
jgi:ATP-dependent helicase/nuclease subunit A